MADYAYAAPWADEVRHMLKAHAGVGAACRKAILCAALRSTSGTRDCAQTEEASKHSAQRGNRPVSVGGARQHHNSDYCAAVSLLSLRRRYCVRCCDDGPWSSLSGRPRKWTHTADCSAPRAPPRARAPARRNRAPRLCCRCAQDSVPVWRAVPH